MAVELEKINYIIPKKKAIEPYSVVTREPLDGKPNDYSELQQVFRVLAQTSPNREVAASFYTNGEGNILPVYALCGERYSVQSLYQDEYLARLLLGSRFNTYVRFHSHPEWLTPGFSSGDDKNFEALQAFTVDLPYDLGVRIRDRKISVYDVVGTLTDQYKWRGFRLTVVTEGLDSFGPPKIIRELIKDKIRV